MCNIPNKVNENWNSSDTYATQYLGSILQVAIGTTLEHTCRRKHIWQNYVLKYTLRRPRNGFFYTCNSLLHLSNLQDSCWVLDLIWTLVRRCILRTDPGSFFNVENWPCQHFSFDEKKSLWLDESLNLDQQWGTLNANFQPGQTLMLDGQLVKLSGYRLSPWHPPDI